jgi:hypothetical protein
MVGGREVLAVGAEEALVEARKQSLGLNDRRLGTIEQFRRLLEVS